MISLTTLSKKLALLCMLLLGLQCLTVQGMKKRKRNIFEGTCKESSTERLPLFQKLYSKYIDGPSYAQEDSIALKDVLIRMNKTSKASTRDIVYCIAKVIRSNCQMWDTILPHLFEGHDLSKNNTNNTNTSPLNGWLDFAASNTYFVKSLLYFYNVPLSDYEAYGYKFSSPYHLACNRIIDYGFFLNEEYYRGHTGEDRITYVKAILTPPDRFIQEARECSLPTIKTFLLCTKRLQRSLGHRIPKILVNTLIMPVLINNAIPEKHKDRCQQIKAEVRGHIKNEILQKKYYDGPNGAYNFLANDFEAWAENNMDIAILAYPNLFGTTQ